MKWINLLTQKKIISVYLIDILERKKFDIIDYLSLLNSGFEEIIEELT